MWLLQMIWQGNLFATNVCMSSHNGWFSFMIVQFSSNKSNQQVIDNNPNQAQLQMTWLNFCLFTNGLNSKPLWYQTRILPLNHRQWGRYGVSIEH
jgi:hypothetical protein